MLPAERIYSVLIVSAAEKVNNALLPFFRGGSFEPVTVVDTIAKAQRRLSDRDYDLVLINAPLPDDFGRKFAVDVCTESDSVAAIIVRSEMYDEISTSMTPKGVMVVMRPLEEDRIGELIGVMCSFRERLKKVRKKTMSLEDKMEEIRLVNRAKWALIKACHMTCLSKKETAENILKTYG